MNQGRSSQIFIGIVIVLLAAGLGGYVLFESGRTVEPTPIAQSLPTPATLPIPAKSEEINLPQIDTSQSQVGEANWKTYKNTLYGFAMQYPSAWKLENKLPSLFSFTARNGLIATFSIIDNITRYDGPQHVYQNVYIGNELGLEWANIICETNNPCAAVFRYHSNDLDSSGFTIHLVIPITDSDFQYSTAVSFDPRPIFPDDIAAVRKVLSTLQSIE